MEGQGRTREGSGIVTELAAAARSCHERSMSDAMDTDPTQDPTQDPTIATRGQRLRAARLAAGYSSGPKAAAAYGGTVETSFARAVQKIRDPAWLAGCLTAMQGEPGLAEEILAIHGGPMKVS